MSSTETVLIEKEKKLFDDLSDNLSNRNDTRQRNIAHRPKKKRSHGRWYTKKVPIALVGLILQLHRAAWLSRIPTITVW